jgi:hypothetical protein
VPLLLIRVNLLIFWFAQDANEHAHITHVNKEQERKPNQHPYKSESELLDIFGFGDDLECLLDVDEGCEDEEVEEEDHDEEDVFCPVDCLLEYLSTFPHQGFTRWDDNQWQKTNIEGWRQ